MRHRVGHATTLCQHVAITWRTWGSCQGPAFIGCAPDVMLTPSGTMPRSSTCWLVWVRGCADHASSGVHRMHSSTSYSRSRTIIRTQSQGHVSSVSWFMSSCRGHEKCVALC